MENKEKSSKPKLISKEEEFHTQKTAARSFKNRCLSNYDLKIQKKSCNQKPRQRIYVTIKSRSPAIKTIFLAEKSRFYSRKGSRSTLAIGDHPSFSSRIADNSSSFSSSYYNEKQLTDLKTVQKSIDVSEEVKKQVQVHDHLTNSYKEKLDPRRTCYSRTLPQITFRRHLKLSRNSKNTPKAKYASNFIVAHSSQNKNRYSTIAQLQKTINLLKRRVQRQEMVLGATDSSSSSSTSDEGCRENIMKSRSTSTRPRCSYIEHYSHIPETSAFQRYAQASLTNRGATIERGYNSEQYGRNFTAYDGITARSRRQSASVTYKREDHSRQAAEKAIKIRHKLHPVRDYRLMDTVHYLAQGEFAPRNDGIKLTPSREAVLSDIIWEDVCRTHWPSTRLGRRQQDRSATRYELQRLIDNLLRERIAHVERRRRRHYRTVKLNHRQENSVPPLGKTGDIIVASHKHKHQDDDSGGVGHESSGAIISSQKWQETNSHRSHRSHECLVTPESSRGRRVVQEECTPGPSYAVFRNRRPDLTFCCQAAGPSTQPESSYKPKDLKKYFSGTSTTSSEIRTRNPRLVIKKNSVRRKHIQKDGINLENFILLPTLVFRTPSNVNRQKKFKELYHRILSHFSTGENNAAGNEPTDQHFGRNSHKKDPSM